MQYNIFIKTWFWVVAFAIIMIALVNYLIDPFGVFHTNLLIKSKSLNERVVKIDYLNAHKDRYNAFMFGSSTMGTSNPSTLEKYIPRSKFYNLTCSSSNMYDFRLLLEYLLDHDFDVKHLYMQIDLTSLREYGKHPNPAQRHHYALTNTPAWRFYLEYLTIFPFTAMKAKVMMAVEDANATRFDIENTGRWFVDYKDKQRAKDIDAYIANEASFHTHARRTRGEEKNIGLILKDYQAIVKRCHDKGVDLKVLITGYNHLRMDSFKIEDVMTFLRQLSAYHDIWYFAGYNTITNNDKNYYEVNHYIPKIGDLMAARIYHDSTVNVPDDFGVLLTKGNIKSKLKILREQMLSHDKALAK